MGNIPSTCNVLACFKYEEALFTKSLAHLTCAALKYLYIYEVSQAYYFMFVCLSNFV